MSTQSESDYASTCASIESALSDCNYKIKMDEANRGLIEQYQTKIEELQGTVGALDTIKQLLQPMSKDIKEYLAARRKQSMQSINNAIRIASEIIPDAMPNVVFELKGDEAWLQTTDGLLVSLSEGAGYKSILSAFLRSVTLNSNPSNLQLIIFDEIFSYVSVEHSATLSAFLKLMTQNMQVISIEQKPEVYSNTDYVNYSFTKSNDYTTVKKEVITNANLQAQGLD